MLTRPEGAFDRRDAKPGMAYFAGTGPRGKVCKTCLYIHAIENRGRTQHRCGKYTEMTGRQSDMPLNRYNDACKYYTEKAP